MEKYYYYSQEITKDELYEGLVGCGLFADKIPNFLTSEDFLDYSKTINLPGIKDSRDYIRYNSMRNVNIPRALAIPDPFVYASLCKELKNNWNKLQNHFKKHTKNDEHKISRIHLRKMYKKCPLFEMNYKNLYDDGEPHHDLLIKSRFLAIADISKCFPSIYSHAIPWALVGKRTAKLNKTKKSLWYNKIDSRVRNVKFAETNGVLIGPHASNLISEIILTNVDHAMVDKGFKFVRNIDDYVCFSRTFEEAEKFQLELSIELEKYELSLNLKKSEIVSLPKATVKNWVNRLGHYAFVDTYKSKTGKEAIKAKAVQAYLDFAIELMIEDNNDSAVLNYAIKVIANKHLGWNAEELLIKRVHHLVLLYPYLIQILEQFVFDPHNIPNSSIEEIANDVFDLGIEKKIAEPCSYSIYWALRYDFKLSIKNLKKKALESDDCIFMLLAFLYHKKYKSKSFIKDYMDKAEELSKLDFERYWLFCYEVLPQTKLIDDYKAMKKKKISFVEEAFKF